ncbi:MAG: permease [candidate division WOR-3 bacterium]
MNDDLKKLIWILGVFLTAYFIPINSKTIQDAILSSFFLLQDYAQKHVILCLIPAFFIAGAMGVFISSDTVLKYLGSKANQIIAYLIASVSGTILAVCSCTVLPLFAGIYKKGAGLGPAIAFLYSGPAINVLAIILTAKVLGFQIGLFRAIFSIFLSIIIGIMMALTFREKKELTDENGFLNENENDNENERNYFILNLIYFFAMIGILVFSNWAKTDNATGFWYSVFKVKWLLVSIFTLILGFSLKKLLNIKTLYLLISSLVLLIFYLTFKSPIITFVTGIIILVILLLKSNEKSRFWLDTTKDFAFQIIPLLFSGILIAGFLLGTPDGKLGIIPQTWISRFVGGNSILSNLFASIVGAFMYFATLTEVPIIQGLMNAGMGKGPALSLLLAGPALSLPNMLVIRSIIGTKKTVFYVSYVIILSTIAGFIFGLVN